MCTAERQQGRWIPGGKNDHEFKRNGLNLYIPKSRFASLRRKSAF